MNINSLDQIDAAIDQFEAGWSPKSAEAIRSILAELALESDAEAMAELIRIDIEKRYYSGLACHLGDYLEAFPVLSEHPNRVAEIAFEDYRVRARLGHAVSPGRYSRLPGVAEAAWFRTFQGEVSLQDVSLQEVPAESLTVPGEAHLESLCSLEAAAFGRTESSEFTSRVQNGYRVDGEKRDRAPERRRAGEHPRTSETSRVDDAALVASCGFRLVGPLGEGAFSRVYLATQKDLAERYVVLKLVDEPRVEPQMLAMLQHTNIVPIYSYHWVDSLSVICMPYAGSTTLADFVSSSGSEATRDGQCLVRTLRRHADETVDAKTTATDVDALARTDLASRFTSARAMAPVSRMGSLASPMKHLESLDREGLAVHLFSRLASALAHSHARGVLHNDLKPANVLIRNDGEPALLDFNLSRHSRKHPTASVGGTIAYMSPESFQALMGAPTTIDTRSDIYSLGMMLFEFVTGRLPYPRPATSAASDVELAMLARHEQVGWHADDLVSASLRAIIDRCLAPRVDDRYSSADQLLTDLQRHASDAPLAFAKEPVRQRLLKWGRRHPSLTSGGAIATLAAGLLIVTVGAALELKNRATLLSTSIAFDGFALESTDALLAAVADPARNRPATVEALLKPLRTHHLDQPETIDRLLTEKGLDEEVRQTRQALMYRHVVQTAIAESCRLKSLRHSETLQDGSLNQLDELISLAERLSGEDSSRALAHLRATRESFQKAPSNAVAMFERASGIGVANDNESYLEAVRLLSEGQWRRAGALLTALADREAIPAALRWTTLGRSQYQLRDYENAKLSFSQSIERAPQASRLWLLRGLCHRRLNDFERAQADLEKAVALDPVSAASRYALAEVLEQSRAFEESLAQLDSGIRIHPQYVPYRILKSRVLRELGRVDEADAEFMLASEAEDLPAEQLVYRATARMSFEDYDAVIQDLRLALERDPQSTAALHALARAEVKMGSLPAAIESLQKLVALKPESEKARIDLAVLLARSKRFDEAKTQLDKALNVPNAPGVLYQAACVLALSPDQNSHLKALGYLSAAIQRGYGSGTVATDPDLASLGTLPGYRAIVRTAQLARIPQAESGNELSDENDSASETLLLTP